MRSNILIVGGGIAGLTSAIALSRMGAEVTVVEKRTEWNLDGAGIMLQSNALAILDALGLGDAIRSSGCVLPGVELRDQKGRILLGAASSKLGEIVSIHRGKLHQVLLNSCAGVTLKLGVQIQSLETQENDYVTVAFKDGFTCDYDLVLGADGLHSQIRDFILGKESTKQFRYSDQVCWRLVVPNIYKQQNALEMWGVEKRVGLIPLADNLLYMFLVKSDPQFDFTLRQELPLRPEEFANFSLHTEDLLKYAVQTEQKILFNALGDLPLEWGSQNVILIGDAAHAMTPNMGQGAAMAFEDVAALVESYRVSGKGQLINGISRCRTKRVNLFRERSYSFGRLAHAQNGMVRAIRNGIIKMTPANIAARSLEGLYKPGIQAGIKLGQALKPASSIV
ncbi:MAG: FAD-dependent oxidoreductase [Gammaproteobacteria bacterium]|nr:FAD-dependent oxidoreductase [Gammaproteobacteria bacterium]